MKKLILIILVTSGIIFGLFFYVKDNKQLNRKIEDLESQISDIEYKNADLEDQINELDSRISELEYR